MLVWLTEDGNQNVFGDGANRSVRFAKPNHSQLKYSYTKLNIFTTSSIEFRQCDNYDTYWSFTSTLCMYFLNKEMTAAWLDTSVFFRYGFSFPGSKVQKSEDVRLDIISNLHIMYYANSYRTMILERCCCT